MYNNYVKARNMTSAVFGGLTTFNGLFQGSPKNIENDIEKIRSVYQADSNLKEQDVNKLKSE